MRRPLNGRGLALCAALCGYFLGWGCATLQPEDRLLVGLLAAALLLMATWRLGGQAQAPPRAARLSLVRPERADRKFR